MKRTKVVVEYQLVVVSFNGKVYDRYKVKTETNAIKDAEEYKSDRLGRSAYVEKRTVTTTPWVKVMRDSREQKEDDRNGTLA